ICSRARAAHLVARLDRIRTTRESTATWRSVRGKLDHRPALLSTAAPQPADIYTPRGAHTRARRRWNGGDFQHRAHTAAQSIAGHEGKSAGRALVRWFLDRGGVP